MTKIPKAWTVGVPGAVSSEFAHLVCLAQGTCVAGASLQNIGPHPKLVLMNPMLIDT